MNDLTAYDFWGDPTWVGGDDEERCKRLRAYEKTGMEPEEITAMQRDNEKYRLAGLRYEEEIAKLKRKLAAAVKDLRLAADNLCNQGAIPKACKICKHLHDICEDCYWEWRGVCKENTEANQDEEV